jgi:hypothetical protein
LTNYLTAIEYILTDVDTLSKSKMTPLHVLIKTNIFKMDDDEALNKKRNQVFIFN